MEKERGRGKKVVIVEMEDEKKRADLLVKDIGSSSRGGELGSTKT